MKTKHTPGPWECDTGGQPIIINGPEEGEANIVALVYDDHCPPRGVLGAYLYGEERAAANARLIEAAPELLRELKNCVAAIQKWGKAHPESGGWTGLIHGGLAAIMKAEGEA